ncbi:sensor histidine kinase [Cohaesibacter intestini]|uniref:sensor histidine kinase n=1 Tax=Cohaesibacter intestini TaxID=2211145 RepID=UPI0018E50A46|nr:ATP-binding protein [Cohaesibacter intestini]
MVFAVLLCVFYYNYTRKIVLDSEIRNLREETRIVAQKFAGIYKELQNEAFIISQLPPIAGLIASTRNNDVDPKDGSTTAHWRGRLETIFISLLRARSHYTQLHYIGVADGGRELVRVDQTNDGIDVVTPQNLQQKEGERYFQESLRLQAGQTYFSDVTYNREHGKVDTLMTPTLRTIVPVFDDDGQMFGLVVINVNYEKLMQLGLQNSTPSRVAYAINNHGDYLKIDALSKFGSFEFHEDQSYLPSELVAHFKGYESDEGSFKSEDALSYFVKLNVNPGNPDVFVGVAQTTSRAQALAPVIASLRSFLFFSFFLVALISLLTLPLARRMSRALQAIAMALQSEDASHFGSDLPVYMRDEIGALARASRRMALDLNESRAKAATVLENVADAILTFDDEQVVIGSNRAAEPTFGYSRDTLIGKRAEEILLSQDGEPISFVELREDRFWTGSKEHAEYEVIGLHASGRTFPAMLTMRRVDITERFLLTVVVRDITERKRQEEEREDLIARLVRSNQELDSFAHIAAHDLREPLRAIHNHSSFLLEDYDDVLDCDGKKRLDRLQFLTKRMERLVADLLHFSRLGQQDAVTEPTDLAAVLADIEMTSRDGFEADHVKLTISSDLPTVVCDKVRVTEVFRNLIVNAAKYNDKDQKLVDVGYDPQTGIFSVRDNGVGIDETYHNSVFKLFKRLESSNDFSDGTGAGLTFVEKIIHQHGGSIWLQSELGKGTTFFFTLSASSDPKTCAEREAA